MAHVEIRSCLYKIDFVDCALTYEVTEAKTVNREADLVSHVATVSACAKDCFVYECSEAYFIPVPSSSNDTGSCQLFFGSRNCTDAPITTYYESEKPVRITCITCSKFTFLGILSLPYCTIYNLVQNAGFYSPVQGKGPGEVIELPPREQTKKPATVEEGTVVLTS